MNKYRFRGLVGRLSMIVLPAVAACTMTGDEDLREDPAAEAQLGSGSRQSPEPGGASDPWAPPSPAPLPDDGHDPPGDEPAEPSEEEPTSPDAPDPVEPAPERPTPPDPPKPPKPPAPSKPIPYRGVNLAGGEFGTALPGTYNRDYTFSKPSEIDYYMGKGMNTFRIGFKWERMQHSAYGAFDATYFKRLDDLVKYATSKGATVILNPHNYARYYDDTVGSSKVPNAVFADFWSKLSSKYKGDANVMFNLVNEPHTMPTEQWVRAANAAIKAIRDAGANNVIVVPGNAWTGAHSWYRDYYGTPNAKAMLDIVDPKDNVLFEVHQYLDANSGGGSSTCVSRTIGSERMKDFVRWLRDNKKKGFVGEFAGADNSTCNAAVKDMLDFMHASSDVLVGWAWWAGGPWWKEYKFTLHPNDGKDRPQMALLLPYLDQ